MKKLQLGILFLISLLAFAAPGFSQQAGEIPSKASGIVVAARSWDVSAEIDNKISRLHFVEGQIVKKGDLLVEFDTAFKKLAVESAKAALARAAGQMKLAQDIFQRQEKLKRKEASSLAQYNEALFSAEIAKAEHRAAEIELKKAEAILAVQKLYAPFDGQMSAPRYRENANVDIAEGTEIATLVQLDPIHVAFSVPYERVFARMSAGETEEEIAASIRVVLTLPNGTKYPHEGRLIAGGFNLDPEKGTQTVLVEFSNPRRILRPGLKVIGTGYAK